MRSETDDTLDQLRALPVEERLDIIEALWASIDEEAGHVDLPPEVIAESEREMEAHAADPSSSIPWETVRARLRARFGPGDGGTEAGEEGGGDISIHELRILPLEKRLEIVKALWDSVEGEVQKADIPDDVYEDSMRELAAHDADPSSSIPWQTVYAKLRAKHG